MYNKQKPFSDDTKKIKVKINLSKAFPGMISKVRCKGEVVALNLRLPLGLLYENTFGDPLIYFNAIRLKGNNGWVIKQQLESNKYKELSPEQKLLIPVVGDITEVQHLLTESDGGEVSNED